MIVGGIGNKVLGQMTSSESSMISVMANVEGRLGSRLK